MSNCKSEFALLQPFCILGYHELVDAVLDIAVHEGREVIDGVVDAVVGDTSLRIVVGAYLGRAVTRIHHRLALRGNVVDVLLVLLVVDEGTQAGQCALLVLRLIASLGTLDEDFLHLARIGVLPIIAETYT